MCSARDPWGAARPSRPVGRSFGASSMAPTTTPVDLRRAVQTRAPVTVGHVLGAPFVSADAPLATWAAAQPVPLPPWVGSLGSVTAATSSWLPTTGRWTGSPDLAVRGSSLSGTAGRGRSRLGGLQLGTDETDLAGGCDECPEDGACYTIMSGHCREVDCGSDLCECGPCEGTGCDTLLVPPEGRSHDCALVMSGNETECTACDRTRDGGDFEAMATDYVDDLVNMSGFDGSAADLVMHAWALLYNNTDLVKWAVCWVTGNAAKGDCLLARIRGESANVNLKMKSGDAHQFYTSGSHFEPFYGGTIQVYEDGKWQEYLAVWDDDELATDGTPIGRMCAAVDLSCTLLHELTHVCWRAWSDEADTCRKSYLIENAFRWAMFRRYPAALQSACCGGPGLGDADVFGSSQALWLNDNCVGSASGSSGGTTATAAYKLWWLEHHADKPGTTFSDRERL